MVLTAKYISGNNKGTLDLYYNEEPKEEKVIEDAKKRVKDTLGDNWLNGKEQWRVRREVL